MEIRQEPVSPELKETISQGFKEHAIEQTGQAGIGDPIAFVALENGNYAGAVVAGVAFTLSGTQGFYPGVLPIHVIDWGFKKFWGFGRIH